MRAAILILCSAVLIAAQERIVPKTLIDRAGVEEREETSIPRIGKAELGKALFFDPILSANGKVSCATCHREKYGWSSGGIPDGLDGKPLLRRAPSLLNVGDRRSYFLDGRATSLQTQAREVLLNPREMGNRSMQDVLLRVKKSRGIDLTESQLLDAIAAFERTIKTPPGVFDQYFEGDTKPDLLTASERRGYELFRGKANCYKCHPPTKGFSDELFHNTGSAADAGRAAITNRVEDTGKLRTPALRGCKASAPYFNAAQLRTLEDVVEFYDRGGRPNKYLDREMIPLRLTPAEKRDLISFLRVL